MEKFSEMRNSQRADGAACILAIGTAVPSNVIKQTDYPDYYFRVTNSEHMVELKDKFKHICEKSNIKKRHFVLTEDILKANPCMLTYGAPSLNARRSIINEYVPKLGKEAALKAIEDWGQPKSSITHLIVYTTLAFSMPGVDYEVAKLLGLDMSSVHRTVMYLVGCYAAPHILRQAKDIVENNKGARVLAVFIETTVLNFHGPTQDHMDLMVGQALFGDGAAAVIVGADPDMSIERPLFQIVHGVQTTIPDTTGPVVDTTEMGQVVYLPKDIPISLSNNIQECLSKAFKPIGIDDWNTIFWITHNGGPAILDKVEATLNLEKDKLQVSRDTFAEFGNMACVGVIFRLDATRKRSIQEKKGTTGFGLDWGVMFGIGPGMTIEMLVLRSVPLE